MTRVRAILILAFLLTTLPVLPAWAARLQPTSDLLLPRFEIDPGVTTVFSVGNASEKPVEVLATVSTDRGIALREVTFNLKSGEVRTVDLRDWLAPAAPSDHQSMVGSVTLRTRSGRRDALWGDWSAVDAGGSTLRGGTLVDIDRSGSHSELCRQHLLRYEAGTEILVWRQAAGLLDQAAVADLGVQEPSGALRIDTEEDVYIAGAYCVAGACANQRTALDVNLLLDGRIADEARGPLVDSGSPLTWTLVITNTGELPVSGIRIEGLDAACPGRGLEAGESMECTAEDVALSNPQSIPVLVTAHSSCDDVSKRTTGYYEGVLVDVFP